MDSKGLYLDDGVMKDVFIKTGFRKLGLSAKHFCFDLTVIEFEQYFKPTKPNQVFAVGLFHKFISAN